MITLENESLARYSSFRTGGCAGLLVMPETAKELETALDEYPDAPVLGNLTNTLITDRGVSGAVILTQKIKGVSRTGNAVTAQAGTPLSAVAVTSRDASLTGAEFLYGIPGTVGGGIYMNAGAYGGEISQIITSATLYSRGLKSVFTASADALGLGYRRSTLMDGDLILISATFTLAPGSKDEISRAMEELMSRRTASQPLDRPSCGSTFKRPEGHYAGQLIEQCGLRGASVGGAQVSEKHAGFIINKGGATSEDILALIDLVKRTVLEKTGVTLEEEIRIIGD